MTHGSDRQASGDWEGDSSFFFHDGEIPVRPRRSTRPVLGNGRLATERDLESLLEPPGPGRERGLVLKGVTPLVEDPDDASILRPLLHRSVHLVPDLRERHVLAVGQTGSGKTARLILPALASDLEDPARTIIALDAKGGVFHEVLGRLAGKLRPGCVVHRLNPAHADRSTIRWNPVRSVKTRSDAQSIAHAVCSNVDTGMAGAINNEAFWLFSSINLLSDILLALALDPKEKASLTRAKELVDGFPGDLAEFAEAHPKGFPAINRVLESHSSNPSTSIVADLAMRMLLFDDEGIAKVTGGPDELDFPGLLANGGVLVIEIFEADAARLLPLTNLLIGRLLDDLIRQATSRRDGRLARPTTLVLDELGSACGKIHRFETRIATLRSRGVSIVGAVQTLGQLEQIYGKAAESIVANFGTKIFFGGGLGLADARHASELSGTMTVDLGQDPSNGAGSWASSSSLLARPVLLPDEVARPKIHPLFGPPATVISPDLPPFQAYLTPSYELPGLAWALSPHRLEDEEVAPRILSIEQIEISRLQDELGWDRLEGGAKVWWERLELRSIGQPRRLLSLLRRLSKIQGMAADVLQPSQTVLAEYFTTRRRSNTRSRSGRVSYLAWSLIRRREQQARGQEGPVVGQD